VEPVEPVVPVEPVEPVEPVLPVVPVEPVLPVEPELPPEDGGLVAFFFSAFRAGSAALAVMAPETDADPSSICLVAAAFTAGGVEVLALLLLPPLALPIPKATAKATTAATAAIPI
jgi:hypothetical protein